MENIVNQELKKALNGNGRFCSSDNNLGIGILTEKEDYSYILTKNNFTLQTGEGQFLTCPLNEVDWKLFLTKLETIPVSENKIEKSFQHFPAGSDLFAVLVWIERTFNVSIGSVLYFS